MLPSRQLPFLGLDPSSQEGLLPFAQEGFPPLAQGLNLSGVDPSEQVLGFSPSEQAGLDPSSHRGFLPPGPTTGSSPSAQAGGSPSLQVGLQPSLQSFLPPRPPLRASLQESRSRREQIRSAPRIVRCAGSLWLSSFLTV